MTVSQVLEQDTDNLQDDESKVVGYLRKHPEFFTQHTDLLADLKIDHNCGSAISLIEHQVSALRSQNYQLRRKLQGLIEAARDNEVLAERLHRLTVELMSCQRLDQVLMMLCAALQEDFGAQYVVIQLFGSPANKADEGMAEFVAREVEYAALLEDIQRRGHPLCGRVKAAYRFSLFGTQAESVRSAALLSIGNKEPLGILAVGSGNEEHYHPGMGTHFLRQLADIAERALQPYIENDA